MSANPSMSAVDIGLLVAQRHQHRMAYEYAQGDVLLARLAAAGVRVLDQPLSSGVESSWVFAREIPKTNIVELVRQMTDYHANISTSTVAVTMQGGLGTGTADELCANIKSQLLLFFNVDGSPVSLDEIGLKDREIQG